MNAAEKAKSLVNTFTWQRDEHEKYVAKEMAKSCVDEIVKALDEEVMEPMDVKYKEYWEQVKVEINAI